MPFVCPYGQIVTTFEVLGDHKILVIYVYLETAAIGFATNTHCVE